MTAQQALALANQRIAQLQELADTQAALINEKNDEIAAQRQHIADLEAALKYAQSHDYADDLEADCEAGAIEVEP